MTGFLTCNEFSFLVYVIYLAHNAQCGICIKGPPERQNLKTEAMIILQVVVTHCVSAISDLLALLRTLSSHFGIAGHYKSFLAQTNFADICYGGYEGRVGERPNIKALVSRIREQVLILFKPSLYLYPLLFASLMCMPH